MITTYRPRWTSFSVAIAALLGGRLAAAQDSTCTYERCALRLKSVSAFSAHVIAGASARPVPVETLLSRSGDSVRAQYQAFQRDRGRAEEFALFGLTTMIVQLGLWDAARATGNPTKEAVAFGLIVVPVSLVIAANRNVRNARHHLERAIGFYNDSLPGAR